MAKYAVSGFKFFLFVHDSSTFCAMLLIDPISDNCNFLCILKPRFHVVLQSIDKSTEISCKWLGDM